MVYENEIKCSFLLFNMENSFGLYGKIYFSFNDEMKTFKKLPFYQFSLNYTLSVRYN